MKEPVHHAGYRESVWTNFAERQGGEVESSESESDSITKNIRNVENAMKIKR